MENFDILSFLPLLVPLILLQVGLMIYCLVDLSRRRIFKYLPKWGWALIIFFGQLWGPVLYLLIARGEE